MSRPQRTLRVAALLASGLAGLAGGSAPPSPRPSTPPSEAAADLVNALLGGLLGFGEASEEELRAEVEQAGGVPFREPVPIDFLTHAQLEQYFAELFDSEYPGPKARTDERLLRAFDLLAPGVELRETRRRLLLDNVVGFYDERPGRRRLFAVSAERRFDPANQLVLVHELRHALQDQYLRIHDALPGDVSDFDDRRLALLSLLEGDATLVMERFLLSRLSPGEGSGLPAGAASGLAASPPEIEGAPPVLRDQLVLPYLAGLDLARDLVARGGLPALRAAWDRPPVSTEQVLHPDKYAAGEAALDVPADPAPLGARLLIEGVLGEMLARSLLGDGAPEAATAGWGGDRYRLFDVAGRTLLRWSSRWDSEADAREFEEAALRRFRSAYGAPQQESGAAVFDGRGWRFGFARTGDLLRLVASDDARAFAAALAAAPKLP
ncbi:MAG: hypothetical protein AB7O37_17520 [Vicinamibacteria bacterium]